MNRSLLFADFVRRHRWLLASLGTASAVVWFWLPNLHMAVGASLLVASVFGLFPSSALAPMAVQVLPISRREIARTLWWTSTVLPVAILATGKVVGWLVASIFGPVAVGLDTIWLSTAMDFVGAGAVLAGVTNLQTVTRRVRNETLQGVLTSAMLLTVISTPLAAMFLRDSLPVTWGAISPMFAAFMVAGAALTALAYAAVPRVTVGPNPHALAGALATRRKRGVQLPLGDLTGLRRLAFKIWISSAFSLGGMAIFFVIFSAFVDGFPGEGFETLREYGFMPFEAAWKPHTLIMLFVITAMSVRWESGAMGTGTLASLRHMRTLPFSARQLNAVFLALPLIAWANSWMVLLAFHWTINRDRPASWRLLEFFAAYGLDCLAKALQLRYQSAFAAAPVALLAGAFLVVTLKYQWPLSPMLFAFGAACLLTASALNHNTLTTRRRIYAPQKYRAFGVELPGQ